MLLCSDLVLSAWPQIVRCGSGGPGWFWLVYVFPVGSGLPPLVCGGLRCRPRVALCRLVDVIGLFYRIGRVCVCARACVRVCVCVCVFVCLCLFGVDQVDWVAHNFCGWCVA